MKKISQKMNWEKLLISEFKQTTVYGCTAKTLDDQSLAADLSSDLDLTAQWGKNLLVTFNVSKIKLVTFHHHQSGAELPPIAMNRCCLREAPCLEHLLEIQPRSCETHTCWKNSWFLLPLQFQAWLYPQFKFYLS